MKQINKDDAYADEDNTQKQEADNRETVTAGRDLVNMHESKGEENERKHGITTYFHDLRKGMAKQLRKPKFFVELLALVGLVLYTCETRRTNDLTQASLQLQNKPWIAMHNVNTDKTVDTKTEFGAYTTVENFGHSPASHVMTKVAMRVFCGRFPDDPPYPPAPERRPYGYLMPNESRASGWVSLGHVLTDQEIQNIKSGACGLYMYGEVRYCDIFETSHYRHFCAKWHPETQRFSVTCDTYSDADDDYYQNKRNVPCAN